MKPSHLAALATMMISPFGYDPGKEPYTPSRAETNRRRRSKSSSASQRQIRRNRRRAHAAGFKAAFA